MSTHHLTPEQIEAEGLADWHAADGALHATFRTGVFAAGLEFVNRIGAEAERVDHHPDVDLRYASVTVHLTSHDADGITRRDTRLARTISDLAAALDLPALPG